MTTPTSQETPMTSLAFTVKARAFTQDIARILPFAGRDVHIPQINGVGLDPTPSGLVAVATDRFRLAATRLAARNATGAGVVLPLADAKRIVQTWKAAAADVDLTVTTTTQEPRVTAWKWVATDGASLAFTTDAGPPIDWRKLVAPYAADPRGGVLAPVSEFRAAFVEGLFRLRRDNADLMRFRVPSADKPMGVHIGDHTLAILMPMRMQGAEKDQCRWIIDAVAEPAAQKDAAA